MQETFKTSTPDTIVDNNFEIRTDAPQILEILLCDQTRSHSDHLPCKPTSDKQQRDDEANTSKCNFHNIIWANDNYSEIDPDKYAPTAQITSESITGEHSGLIVPRALKTTSLQRERTKTRAEVFTPTWIVKKQNDAVDKGYKKDDLETYTRRKWLEITCGEAPYMATRYDMETGKIIPVSRRCGFVDRKLARINKEVSDKAEWQLLVELAYKSSYGFEWNGDSLLLARENLLYTYCDYYQAKWDEPPNVNQLENIATIISYNIFQMDGLTYTIPLSQQRVKKTKEHEEFCFADLDIQQAEEYEITQGECVKIMDWDTLELVPFEALTQPSPCPENPELQLGSEQCPDPSPNHPELQLWSVPCVELIKSSGGQAGMPILH